MPKRWQMAAKRSSSSDLGSSPFQYQTLQRAICAWRFAEQRAVRHHGDGFGHCLGGLADAAFADAAADMLADVVLAVEPSTFWQRCRVAPYKGAAQVGQRSGFGIGAAVCFCPLFWSRNSHRVLEHTAQIIGVVQRHLLGLSNGFRLSSAQVMTCAMSCRPCLRMSARTSSPVHQPRSSINPTSTARRMNAACTTSSAARWRARRVAAHRMRVRALLEPSRSTGRTSPIACASRSTVAGAALLTGKSRRRRRRGWLWRQASAQTALALRRARCTLATAIHCCDLPSSGVGLPGNRR